MTLQRRVTILGATGSVGCSTLDVIAEANAAKPNNPPFAVEALVCGKDIEALAKAAIAHRAKLAVVADESRGPALQSALAGTGIETASGRAAVIEAAQRPADFVMAAIVGAAGLAPTLAAARTGAAIGLANKECLVSAGAVFLDAARSAGAKLFPVDSEHNAIFQVFSRKDDVEKLILTASGGPFRAMTLDAMRSATVEQALNHPNWSMGAKITIDSATLMNKGLELIEAALLFDMPESAIDIVVHPQSIIHSLVAYRDGSVLAQLGAPDMRIPIANVLGWPDRLALKTPRLDLAALTRLDFEEPDLTRFPALSLARQALRTGGCAPTVLNAANEVAVSYFLDRNLGFLDIAAIVSETLEEHARSAPVSASSVPGNLDDVMEVDAQAREIAARFVHRRH